MTNGLKFEVELLYRCPMEVLTRDINGNDYARGFDHIPWKGLKRIRHVTEAICWIANDNNGADIRVNKNMRVLGYDEFLEDLYVSHRKLELSIVINPKMCVRRSLL